MEETRGSGCGKKEKGDVKDSVWNGQAKSTKAASFPLSLKVIDKAWDDAEHMKTLPFIEVRFENAPEHNRRPRHWVVVPAPVFQILKKKLTEHEFALLRT